MLYILIRNNKHMLYIHNCYRTARLKGPFVTYLDIQKYLIVCVVVPDSVGGRF